MWDLRAKACVQDYRGHTNEITHGLPFYVDPTDSLVFAGKYCYTTPRGINLKILLLSTPMLHVILDNFSLHIMACIPVMLDHLSHIIVARM